MSGPAINITTFPVERVLGAARWITSTNTLAASSFSSGEPLMRPSFRRVRAGPMPWGGCLERGGEGGGCLRQGEEGEGKKVGGGEGEGETEKVSDA